MRQYRLSKSKVRGVLAKPKRVEKGIAPGTIAVMQPTSKKKIFGEVWVMYQDVDHKRKIIVAWRYPGKSPIGEEIPIPDDIKEELLTKN